MKASVLFESWLWIIISMFLYVGCTPISPTDIDIPATLISPSITSQSAQPAQTSTSVPTLTVTFTITSTPKPTLTIDEQKNYVTKLVKTKTACQLPCWWGFTPGKTTWKETEKIWRYLGVSIWQGKINSGLIGYSPLFFKGLLRELDLNFSVSKEGVIDAIFIAGNPGGTQEQQDFESFWEAYSPKQVFRMYGVPSRVLLSAPGQTGIGTSGNTGYILWVFYDHLGFVIRYDGTVADLPVYHFCPELKEGSNDITVIRFVLQYPNHDVPLEATDSILKHDMWRVKSIQEATGMSLEEFHQLFSQDKKPACFDAPHNIWPVRQP